MSLVTQMLVAEKYGARLDMEQLAEVLGSDAGGVPTYEELGRRFADFRDVAAYIDAAWARRHERTPEPHAGPFLEGPNLSYTGRRALQTAAWADQRAIDAMYDECRRRSAATGVAHHVDHIIPLKGRLVCGLHVESNLRIISGSENCRKRNKFWVE